MNHETTPFERAAENPGYHTDTQGNLKARCGKCGADCPPTDLWCFDCEHEHDMCRYEERDDMERAFPRSEYD